MTSEVAETKVAATATLMLPPEKLGIGQRRWLVALSLLAAISRVVALSRSPWDGDESLFAVGMRSYDVARHHPHPPGFPLYIATARLLQLITRASDFHALQGINLLASFALLPLVFLLMREAKLSFRVAITTALFTTFLPTVWFFGGTAFSDVASLVLVLAASLFLLRGIRSPRDYLIGTFLLALAIGFRPQNLVVGLAPGLIASWYRWRDRARQVFLAATIGIVIVAGAYGGAASVTGWARYQRAVELHKRYITTIDSYGSPIRPPLTEVAVEFFIKCYGAGVKGDIILGLLSIVGIFVFLFSQPVQARIILAMFGPLALMAWLYLDHLSATRFGIGYIPLLMLCIACGIEPIVAFLERVAPPFAWAPAVVITAALIRAGLPGIVQARTTISPTAATTSWVTRNLDPASTELYVTGGMYPFADEALRRYQVHQIEDSKSVPLLDQKRSAGAWLIQEGISGGKGVDFVRDRTWLWDIARRRFFETSIVPLSAEAHFDEGWYDGELMGTEVWRWMGHHSTTELPPREGPTSLVLRLQFPLDSLPAVPNVTVRMNGALVDQFKGSEQRMTRRYQVMSRRVGTNRLEIETDQVVNPAARHLSADTRDLGLVLTSLSWGGRAGD